MGWERKNKKKRNYIIFIKNILKTLSLSLLGLNLRIVLINPVLGTLIKLLLKNKKFFFVEGTRSELE